MSSERLQGAATPDATRRGAESWGLGARTLGRTGLTVSPVGFGGYRVRADSALHRRALADALRGGVNLIDTSTNYSDGRSEALVGTIVANLVQQGELRRPEVVVVSKIGYVQGQNMARVRARQRGYPEIVEYTKDCWHCIHPDFLRDQLTESLERLGLSQLDVLLLHNPEYFLSDAAHRGQTGDARARYDDRIRRAFAHLEQEVADGRIGWYGVSSNGFIDDADSATWTSVSRVVELAHEVAGDDNRLGVVQLPMNLFELGATLTQHITPQGARTPLEVAMAADLGVLANRPLNAIRPTARGGQLVRLASTGMSGGPDMGIARDALGSVRKLEATWTTGLGQRLRTEDGSDNAVDLFRWGQELSVGLDDISDLTRWQHLRHEVIAPHLGQTSAGLLSSLEGAARAEFADWWQAYGTALHEAFEAIEAGLRSKHGDLARAVAAELDPLLPAPWRELPLSRKAILTLLCTPISAVLVGMRQPGYVHDVLALREHPVRLLSAATMPLDLTAVGAAVAQIRG